VSHEFLQTTVTLPVNLLVTEKVQCRKKERIREKISIALGRKNVSFSLISSNKTVTDATIY